MGSFVIAFYIFELFELVVDSVFLCFMYENDVLSKDREKIGESYAPQKLKKLLEDHGKPE